MTDLRPCPFCGGVADAVIPNEFPRYWVVQCDLCGAKGSIQKGLDGAVNAWNTRVEPTDEELNDEIRKFIDNMKPKESPDV